MKQLREFLSALKPGLVEGDVAETVEGLLIKYWREISGSESQATTPGKLSGRIESLCWEPPHLLFKIERHGGTVFGSTLAEIHLWTVDIEKKAATVSGGRFRRVKPLDRPLDTKRLAADIATLIKRQAKNSRLKWLTNREVRLNMSTAIPATSRQTTQTRRKRFRSDLRNCLKGTGWRVESRGSATYVTLTDSSP